MKKLVLATVISILTFATTESYAACTISGFVERVTTKPGGTSNLIYVRLSSLSNVYYYGNTTDIKLANAANNALTSRTRITIRGTATACPTAGTARNIGAVNLLIVAP